MMKGRLLLDRAKPAFYVISEYLDEKDYRSDSYCTAFVL